MPEDQRQQIAQGRIIRDILKRVPLPFPVNKPDEFKGKPPKSLDQPSADEKGFRGLLNRAQKKAIKDSQQQDDNVRFAHDPIKDDHGCVQADLLIRNGTSAHELAVEAMTGDTTPNILVTSKGGLAVFDAKFSNNAPARFNSDKGSMWEVEHIIPTNAAERTAAQAHLSSKVAQWNHQGKIANTCGFQFKVGIADQGLYEWASQNLKVNPGIQIVQRSIAGSYSEVRAETVGGQVHHTPSVNAQKRARAMRTGGPVTYRSAPGMWMPTRDHVRTGSHSQEPFDDEYRDAQRDFIRAGQSEQAYRMDVQDIQSKFPGKYTHVLRQLEQHVQRDRTFERIDLDTANRQSSIKTPQAKPVAQGNPLEFPPAELLQWANEAILITGERPRSWVFPTHEDYSVKDVYNATNEINESLANINKQASALWSQRDALVKEQDRGSRGFFNLGGMTDLESDRNQRAIAGVDQQINKLRDQFQPMQEKLQESMAFLDNLSAWDASPVNQAMMARLSQIDNNPMLQQNIKQYAAITQTFRDAGQALTSSGDMAGLENLVQQYEQFSQEGVMPNTQQMSAIESLAQDFQNQQVALQTAAQVANTGQMAIR